MEFPKLREKFGSLVTYNDDPSAHIRIEYGFDVSQVAEHHYTPQAYHDFVGFQVSKPVMERAFRKTYGLELGQVLKSEDRSIGTFRWAVTQVMPELTQAAIQAKLPGNATNAGPPTPQGKLYQFHLSRGMYEKEWGKNYERPGLGTRLLAVLIKILPKIGPLKATAIKAPSGEAKELCVRGVNDTVTLYRAKLHEVANGSILLPNLNFDTGKPPRLGEYRLSDETHDKLVFELAKKGDASPALRKNILDYYGSGTRPIHTAKEKRKWQKTQANLEKLLERN
jgi:hypothetical protein